MLGIFLLYSCFLRSFSPKEMSDILTLPLSLPVPSSLSYAFTCWGSGSGWLGFQIWVAGVPDLSNWGSGYG